MQSRAGRAQGLCTAPQQGPRPPSGCSVAARKPSRRTTGDPEEAPTPSRHAEREEALQDFEDRTAPLRAGV